mgnify:CR=1 FL=1
MFIKLTGFGTHKPVFVMGGDVCVIDPGCTFDGNECTGVCVRGTQGNFLVVKETPEQIMEMIEKQKVAVPTNGGYGSTGASNLPHCGAGGRVEILNSSIGVNEK